MKTDLDRMARYVVVVTVVTALPTMVTMGQEPVIGTSAQSREIVELAIRSNWALKDTDQAIAKARKILGVADQMVLPSSAEIVALVEDNTPYLSNQIIARAVWHVVISNWRLELKSAPPDVKDSYARTFDIFLDPLNGHLLRIVSRWPEGVPRIAPEPGAESYTTQMRQSGQERYHALPEEDPPISFLDALDGMFQGGQIPLLEEQLVGQYVTWSTMGRPPRPVWVITLRGTRPLWNSTHPGAAISARNHMRYIVDPKTGKWITGSSTPQPEAKSSTTEEDQGSP